MTGELTFDQIEAEVKAEDPDIIAARSASYEFKGKPLNPLSKGRVSAARSMGHMLFTGRHQPDEGGNYPEFMRDAQIVVWLCTLPDDQIDKIIWLPGPARERMVAWWNAEGGNFGSPEEAEIIQLFVSMLGDIQAVSATVEQTGKGGGPNMGE
jgi:hypothetical protein